MKNKWRNLLCKFLPFTFSKIKLLFLLLCINSISLFAGNNSGIIIPADGLWENEETVQQNKLKIKGTVADKDGVPLPGVTVLEVGTQNGVITDINGEYSIDVQPTESIRFSYVGMVEKTVSVNGKSKINIQLEEDLAKIDEISIVAFGKQRKESVIATIETIDPGELKVSSSNLTTALAGKMSGIISYQRSGEPGQDNATFFIRGVTTFGYAKSPLILLDNFEISADELARIQPDDIKSFSIMKDASATALYGARGANGVIIITTKEGKKGKAIIEIRLESSISQPTRMNEVVDGITYMNLYNQAQYADKPLIEPYYSAQKIEYTRSGQNPFVYPNINWYDELFKPFALNNRFNMNISGGGEVVTYYLSGSFNRDNGILKVPELNNFNNNIQIDRYNLRSNVGIKVSKTTNIEFKFNADFERYNGPVTSATDIFKNVMNVNPVEFPAFYAPDSANVSTEHVLFGNIPPDPSSGLGSMQNPFADLAKGYKDHFKSTINAQFAVNQDLTFIAEGLSARIGATIQSYGFFSSSRQYTPYYYNIRKYNDIKDSYLLQNIAVGNEALSKPEVNQEANARTYFEGRVLYSRTFGKHATSALIVGTAEEKMNQIKGEDGKPLAESVYTTLPSRNLGVAGRLTYGFDDRYILEANFGYNGSEKFSAKHRWGFFPSVGIGYILSNEDYWLSIKQAIDNFKIRATYGLVGNDNIAPPDQRFFFLSEVGSGPGYAFGKTFINIYDGYKISRYANPEISWEIAKKANMGINMSLFKFAEINVDLFYENRTKIYKERSFLPASVGLSAGLYGNVGEAISKGVDASMDFNHAFPNGLWISGRTNFTYASNIVSKIEEPEYKYDYQSEVGQHPMQKRGLVAERLFVDKEEILNSPLQAFGGDTLQAGDIKYKDVNKDGKIDNNDRVPLGFPETPEIVYGFGFSMGMKNFDFSCFFQGSARSSFFIDAAGIAPLQNRRNALAVVANDYWNLNDPDPYAQWPRLSTGQIRNNDQQSSWWLRDGSFLRLKTVEVGYTFKGKFWRSINLTNLRLYATGMNLFSISKFKLWDPEMAGKGLGYPIQRVFNFGIQASF
jgi:TonB-linked SusC/RagA family outer membrane protein